MGGNCLYLQGDYTLGSLTNYDLRRLTSFTGPVTGKSATPAQQQFQAAFNRDFDPNNQYQPNTYGYNLPEAHTMLSYDTMRVLVYASNTLMTYDDVNFSPEDLQAALSQIDAEHPFIGLSWPIAFGALGSVAVAAVSQWPLLVPPEAIAGTVTNSINSGAVVNAQVLAEQGATAINSGVTDTSGHYQINALPAGTYTIVVNNTWTNQAGQAMTATNGNGAGPFTVNNVTVINGQVTTVNDL